MLWEAAGRPDPRKKQHPDAEGECYWCAGDLSVGAVRTKDVCGPMFTDHDAAHAWGSPWICAACAWTMTGRPPDTVRLWSVICRHDGHEYPPPHPKSRPLGAAIYLCNKADPSEVDIILGDPPDGDWMCSVADSGQIHTAPAAVVNHGDAQWCVRFERSDVRCTPAEYRRIRASCTALYAAGFHKEDIETGHPVPGRLLRCGIDLWREHDQIIGPSRGTSLLGLVVFLLRKDKTEDATEERRDGLSSGPSAGDDAQREHGQDQPKEVVGARKKRSRNSGGELERSGIHGLGDGPETADRRDDASDRQLDLFSR